MAFHSLTRDHRNRHLQLFMAFQEKLEVELPTDAPPLFFFPLHGERWPCLRYILPKCRPPSASMERPTGVKKVPTLSILRTLAP
jgi:hypothetical protein